MRIQMMLPSFSHSIEVDQRVAYVLNTHHEHLKHSNHFAKKMCVEAQACRAITKARFYK